MEHFAIRRERSQVGSNAQQRNAGLVRRDNPRQPQQVAGPATIVHAMTGPTLAHARITGKILVAFTTHLRGSPCEPFATGAKLRIRSETDEIVYYPDLVVACNRDEWGTNYVCNPKLVIETLSPSTENIDRREKAMTYRRVASIEEYALLEQDEHKVVVHRRAEDWKPHMYVGRQAVAEFRCIGLSVPLAQIYGGTLPTA
jgi:Uma2 family endonuclease